MKLILFILVFAVCISSCRVMCTSDPDFAAVFKGFGSTDVSYVVEKQYKKNTNFFMLNTVTIWADTVKAWNTSNGVTNAPFPHADNGNFIKLDPAYDYIIEVPNAGKTYYIKSIKIETISGACPGSDWGCTNAATYYLNDTGSFLCRCKAC